MGVELGSSIGVGIGSAGSSFPEGAAASFATVANLDTGPIGGWGKGLAAPESVSFGSRSRSSLSFVEGLPMFNQLDPIINSQSGLNAGDAIFEAESILAQRNVIEAVSLVDYGLIPDFQPQVRPNTVIFSEPTVQTSTAFATKVEVESKVETKSKVESSLLNQVANKAATQEQTIKEEVVEVLDQTESIAGEKIEEEIEKAQILHIVDKKGVIRRIVHAASVILGILQVRKGLDGKVKEVKVAGSEAVLGLLPSNSREIRGEEVNKKDPDEKLPDATWDETKKSLIQNEYTSENQIKQVVANVVERNHPVALSTRGEVI